MFQKFVLLLFQIKCYYFDEREINCKELRKDEISKIACIRMSKTQCLLLHESYAGLVDAAMSHADVRGMDLRTHSLIMAASIVSYLGADDPY